MNIKRKKADIIPSRFLEFLGVVTIILSIGIFITGKSNINEFLENITFLNFISTFAKTIMAYVLAPSVLALSPLIIFDFPLILFGFDYPIANFLWSTLFSGVIVNWWWSFSLPENLFLSVILIYLISRYQIVFNRYVVSSFYIIITKPWYHAVRVSIICIEHLRDGSAVQSGITVGFMLIQRLPQEHNIK